jgi:hypothetical protein
MHVALFLILDNKLLSEQEQHEQTLEKKFLQTLDEIIELDNQIIKNTELIKHKINSLALNLEERLVSGGFSDQVNTVCSTIGRHFVARGKQNLRVYTYEVLPTKYRHNKITELSTSQSVSQLTDLPLECSVTIEELYKSIDTIKKARQSGYLLRNDYREGYDNLLDETEEWKKVCKENKIPLTKEFDELEENRETAEGPEEKNTLEVPPSKMSFEEREKLPEVVWCRKVAAAYEVIALNLINYPIDDNDPLRERIVDGFKATYDFIQHFSDKKYRRHPVQWSNIMREAYEQSGTAAASHSDVECAVLVDPKTGRPRVGRITKEQIDARTIPLLNKFNFMVTHWEGFMSDFPALCEHFEKYDSKWREKRREDLSPKLSARA